MPGNPYQNFVPPNLPFLMAGFAPLVGALPTPAKATLYTVPAGKNTTVASIEILNASGGAANIVLYLNGNGTSFAFLALAMAANDRNVDGLYRNLPEAFKIEGISDVAGVTYAIQYKENTV